MARNSSEVSNTRPYILLCAAVSCTYSSGCMLGIKKNYENSYYYISLYREESVEIFTKFFHKFMNVMLTN